MRASPPDQLSAWPLPKAMMPGAPPVKLLSVAEMTTMPFSRKEIVEPTACSSSWVPAASGPDAVRAAELRPAAPGPLEQHQLRAAVIPVVQADVSVLPAALDPHRRADPLAAGQLRRGHLDLRELIAGERLGRPDVPGDPRRPSRSPRQRRSPSRRQRYQSSSGPARPSARLKLSEAVVAGELAVQETATLVTLAEPTVPEPLVTVQV